MRIGRTGLIGPIALVFFGAAARGQNWPDYRGPNANGHSAATGLPLTWSESEHVKWRIPIHGRAWSSPVIWHDQIWITTATPDGLQMFAVCLDKESGKILLDKKLFENAQTDPISDVNSYGSPSAAIEEGRVYLHFGTYGTACLDTKTFQTVWTRRDLHCRHSVGPGSSPILFRNLLILTFDGTDAQFTIALDKKTGETVWKKNRSVDFPGSEVERRKSFNTPVIIDWEGNPLMISPGASAVYGYDPRTGDEIWRAKHDGYSNSFRTLIGNGFAFVDSGYDRADLLAVKLGGKGDVTNTHIAWKISRNVPFKPSAVLVEDRIYMVTDSGILTCLDAKTGSPVWQERIGGHYSASPIYADGRIYFFSEEGGSLVIKPGDKLEVLARNILNDGFMASAAISGKALFLRTKTALYRIEQ